MFNNVNLQKYHFTAPAFFVFIIITFEYLFCCVCCAIFNNYLLIWNMTLV